MQLSISCLSGKFGLQKRLMSRELQFCQERPNVTTHISVRYSSHQRQMSVPRSRTAAQLDRACAPPDNFLFPVTPPPSSPLAYMSSVSPQKSSLLVRRPQRAELSQKGGKGSPFAPLLQSRVSLCLVGKGSPFAPLRLVVNTLCCARAPSLLFTLQTGRNIIVKKMVTLKNFYNYKYSIIVKDNLYGSES